MKGQYSGHEQANKFLQSIFGKISKGYITLWTPEDKKTHWYDVNNIDSAVSKAMELRDCSNVYFGLGLRNAKLGLYKRGTKDDIVSLPCLWIEIDVKGGDHAANNLPTMLEVEEILRTFPLQPSIVIHSGGGLHCYWLLNQPSIINKKSEMELAGLIISRFQSVFIRLARTKGFHIDNTSDLARVLRVPGTFNRKTSPKPVEMITFKPNIRYSLLELQEAMEAIEDELPEQLIRNKTSQEITREIPNATDLDEIIKGCQFIKYYLFHKDTASYNEWLAALSIASYCEGGEHLVQEWSKGHRGYSEYETNQKYNEIRAKMKPRTCQSINRDFDKCEGCQYLNKINSPISLGMKKRGVEQEKCKNFNRTDLGNAERLIHYQGKNIKYNFIFGKWFLWNGKYWLEDKKNEIQQFAKKTVRNIYKEASDEKDIDKKKYLTEHAINSEASARIGSMISLAKSEVPVLPDDMDKDLWLFNCQNGVIDLKTGDLKPHNRDYMMMKISPVAYHPKAECPTWLRFLEDIMQDDEGNVQHELINFLQKNGGVYVNRGYFGASNFLSIR
ncbi:hypothetical protein [Alkalihalobacterium chitinilyticum]|uniref:Bacteriophage/plasmid primase P4 C-terminal domain-containing protein n=1 Tax=Alkalihalobacterium chitinilyticum TaxID=2980103 RepID=A0ABT5VIJ7_9BACI|nr:hypothetical protein [Alkalihalobacterium chitinilyticum]MDE5414567.1 hypothetical protein [Alkalihalobacterium chitinilyticum]